MQFKQCTLDTNIENLAKEYTYHVFYPENESKPEFIDDSSIFLGTDYATSVICKDRKELDLLLNEITEEYYEILKSEYCYSGIHVVEINGVFCVSLEIDYFEEEKCDEIMNKFIVLGAQCDDVTLVDLTFYRKAVNEGTFKDRGFEDLQEFFEEEFSQLEDEYIANDKEEQFNELEMSIDFYLRILEYCGEGSQKEKLDYIIDQVQDYLII